MSTAVLVPVVGATVVVGAVVVVGAAVVVVGAEVLAVSQPLHVFMQNEEKILQPLSCALISWQ